MAAWGRYVLFRILALFSRRGRRRLHVELVTTTTGWIFMLLLPVWTRRDILFAFSLGLLTIAFFTPLMVYIFAVT